MRSQKIVRNAQILLVAGALIHTPFCKLATLRQIPSSSGERIDC